MNAEAEFPNWWSRLLLQGRFDRQFYIPEPPSLLERGLLAALERVLERGVDPEMPIEAPVFIVGAPRSGTSMLADLLCAHPRAAYVHHMAQVYPDTPLAVDWVRRRLNLDAAGERFLGDSVRVNTSSQAEPFSYWQRWFGRDLESLHWEPLTRADLGEERVAQLYTDIRKIQSLFDTERPRFVCKFATCQPELLMLQELFPDACFVDIVRDGRDVAHSMVKLYRTSNAQLERIGHPLLDHIVPYTRVPRLAEYMEEHGEDSVECAARVWADTVGLVDEARPSLRRYHKLRYEDLLEDPASTMASLFAFLDLEMPTDGPFVEQLAGVGRVRHENDYDQADVVERACTETLRRHGYL